MKRIYMYFTIVCLILLAGMPIQVEAASVSIVGGHPVVTLGDGKGMPASELAELSRLCDDVNAVLAGSGLDITFLQYAPVASPDGEIHQCNISINMQGYNLGGFSEKERIRIMGTALDAVASDAYNISRVTRNKFYDELCKLDRTTAGYARQLSGYVDKDFAAAYAYFRPFGSLVGCILGLFAIGMFLCLSLGIVFDLAYINMPIVQEILRGDMEAREERTGKKMKKPLTVSLEAYKAVLEAESKAGSGYVNPTTLLLKRKIKHYVAIAICLLYLCSGEIYSVIASVIDYFRSLW